MLRSTSGFCACILCDELQLKQAQYFVPDRELERRPAALLLHYYLIQTRQMHWLIETPSHFNFSSG